jgi:nucleoside-diphosphate-sugar epimerase
MVRAHHLRDKVHIAVLGGNGFIGRNFIQSLADQEHLRIWSIDYQQHRVPIETKNAKAIIEQVNLDISTPAISTWLAARPVDVVVYAAGYEAPTDGLGDTKIDVKSLQALVQTVNSYTSIPRYHEDDQRPYFLYLSSWSVYGENNVSISSEEDELVPANYVGMGKMYCEDIVRRVMSKLEVPWCILRPTEVYGKKHHKELRNPRFWPGYFHYYLDKVLRREENIEVFSPDTKIDLMHVNYLSQVMIDCIVHKRTGVYNVSSGHSITIRDLLDRIKLSYGEEVGELQYSERMLIEDMTIAQGMLGELIPYNHSKYSMTRFLDQYIPIRRLEIADDMAIEQIIGEPRVLDTTAPCALEYYNKRKEQRTLDYTKIREVAGPEQFKYIRYGRFQERARELIGYEETESLEDFSTSAQSLEELFALDPLPRVEVSVSPQPDAVREEIEKVSKGRKKRKKGKTNADTEKHTSA